MAETIFLLVTFLACLKSRLPFELALPVFRMNRPPGRAIHCRRVSILARGGMLAANLDGD